MNFQEKLNSGKFVITSEVAPPKGISLDRLAAEIAPFKGRLDAFNVTDLQSSVLRMSALAVSIFLKEQGFEPILQLTCRDRNRLALQADLLSAAAFGIQNVLALTGDHPAVGDHPEAKPVFDLDAVQLVWVIRKLKGGTDMNGHALEGGAPKFYVGAAVNPGADPLEPEIIKMEKKLEAGAEFFQTQAVFDIGLFENFLNATRHLKAKILAGVLVLKSAKTAHYLNEHVPGINVPDLLVREMEEAVDKKRQGGQISIRLIRALKKTCAGVHIMPLAGYEVMPAILEAVRD